MALIRDVIDRVLFPNRELHVIPVLDGPFSPNNRLDQSRTLGAAIDAPDDLVGGENDDVVYVSSRQQVLRCTGPQLAQREVFARLSGPAGALARTRDGRLLVAVSGLGLVALSPSGMVVGTLAEAAGVPILCATAVVAAADGTIYLCDGSRHNRSEDWLSDLMQARPPSGRLIACDERLENARVLADRLDWPSGVALSPDGRELLVAESWSHRLRALSLAGGAWGDVVRNYAGYPARIAADGADGYWMAFFGMRTQLIEFVLRERAFCESMMARVPRELWIGPSLEGGFDYREPTQIGRIKKLGIQKPWAPPRSYGLVARLDRDAQVLQSLHSRVEGRVHGVTAVRRVGARVLAVAKGRGLLVELPPDAATGEGAR